MLLFFVLKEGFGTKNSAVYSMRGTLQYRFTTARVQWPCSTDIHWACLITQSGPARYVPNRRLAVLIECPKVENNLRVREGFFIQSQRHRRGRTFSEGFRVFIFYNEDHKVAVKNYAVHQSLEDPGSASQQSECNDPAPH